MDPARISWEGLPPDVGLALRWRGKSLLWKKEVLATAKETGLIVHERKIEPVIIFWILTLSFGVRLQRTLASLKREYEKEANKTVSDSSWYYRFTPELVEFLHQCVIHGIEELAKDPGRKLSKILENFQDILIQDSTIVRLHSSLADKFPAARSRTAAAGVKVGFLQKSNVCKSWKKRRIFCFKN